MFSAQRAWEDALDALLAETRPILEVTSAEAEQHLPKIPNIVTTVLLLEPNSAHRLPLRDIALSNHSTQFDPDLFAAVRITLRDNTSQATALLFAPGSMVVTGSRSEHQALYWSRVVFLRISMVRFACIGDGGRIETVHLATRLRFDGFTMHNHVANGELGYQIDLEAIRAANGLQCMHYHDLFPGLIGNVWLTPDYRCHCKTTRGGGGGGKNRDSCKCVLSVLFFKTGKIVIPGCKTMRDANMVFYRICTAMERFKATLHPPPQPPPPLLAEAESKVALPALRKRAARAPEEEEEEEEQKADKAVPLKRAAPTLPAVFALALADRLPELVRLLSLMPKCVRDVDRGGLTVLERMAMIQPQDRQPNYEAIVASLENASRGRGGGD